MKISILCFDLSSNAFGRAGLLAIALSKFYDVEIIGPSKSEKIWAPMAQIDIPIKKFVWERYPGFHRIKKKIMDVIDGDVILASKLMPTSFGIGLQKKISSGKPLLLDIDDWELGFFYHSGFWGKVGRFLNFSNPNGLPYVWRIERLVDHADAVSVSNRFLQNKFGGSLLPHCRDTDVLNPLKFNTGDVKERMGFAGKKILMFLGTPRPHKGIDDLLQAFKKVDNSDLNLVIIGVENKQEFLKGIDESVINRVTIIPKIPFNKLSEYLSVADIISIPQRRTSDSVGQIPARLFDAMAMGKPIIATRVSDIPEVLGDCGYLVDPSNPSQLANAIQYVLNHSDEARVKGDAARARCRQKYDIRNLESGLRGLIEQVAGKKVN
ncbi:MAG: glycosyltransferase family 4 protein [Nitrospina sp.]|nr:glycosyltransferase family 4 protein [Nitrospina sp.]